MWSYWLCQSASPTTGLPRTSGLVTGCARTDLICIHAVFHSAVRSGLAELVEVVMEPSCLSGLKWGRSNIPSTPRASQRGIGGINTDRLQTIVIDRPAYPIAMRATARLDPQSPTACHHHILWPRITTPRSTATAAYCEPATLTTARLPPRRARTNKITAAIPNTPATKEVTKALRFLGKIRGPVVQVTEIATRNATTR